MSTQAGKNPKRLIESTVASIPQESNRTDEGRQELKGGTNAKESEHTDERRPGPSQQDAEEAREPQSADEKGTSKMTHLRPGHSRGIGRSRGSNDLAGFGSCDLEDGCVGSIPGFAR